MAKLINYPDKRKSPTKNPDAHWSKDPPPHRAYCKIRFKAHGVEIEESVAEVLHYERMIRVYTLEGATFEYDLDQTPSGPYHRGKLDKSVQYGQPMTADFHVLSTASRAVADHLEAHPDHGPDCGCLDVYMPRVREALRLFGGRDLPKEWARFLKAALVRL